MTKKPSLPPFPGVRGGETLRGVVTELTTTAARGGFVSRDPDEPKVRWFLEAGVRELLERFTNYAAEEATPYSPVNDFLGTLSGADVMRHYKQLAREHQIDVGNANVAQFNKYWDFRGAYHRDLLQYVFRLSTFEHRMDDINAALPEFMQMPFGDLVAGLAVAESNLVTNLPELQLQMTFQAAFPNDPRIRELSHRVYAYERDAWAEIYEKVASAYGFSLQAGLNIGWTDLAVMFSVIVEGAGLRGGVSPELSTLTDGTHVSVRTIQLLLAQFTGEPWEQLAQRTAG